MGVTAEEEAEREFLFGVAVAAEDDDETMPDDDNDVAEVDAKCIEADVIPLKPSPIDIDADS